MSDDEDFARERQMAEVKAEARLLGSAMRTPTIMQEVLQLGADVEVFCAPTLRHAFQGMRMQFVSTGACDATSTENYLDIVLKDPAQARDVVDFCLRAPDVRHVDDVARLLQQMRERVGRRRLGRVINGISRDAETDVPLVDLLARARREIEDISSTAIRGHDRMSGSQLASVLGDLAAGTLTFRRFPLGIPTIDKAQGGGSRVATTSLIIAAPGTGKTSFGLHGAIANADAGRGVLVVCLEDKAKAQLTLAETLAGCRLPVPQNAGASVWTEVARGKQRSASWPSFEIVFRRNLTAEGVMAEVRRRKRTHPVDVVVVDYVQRILPSDGRDGPSAFRHISDVLCTGAIDEDVLIVELSQVSAAGKERLAKDKSARLGPDDCAGGAAFNEDAATTITIERPRADKDSHKRNVSTCTLGKSRDTGQVIEAFMSWSPETTRLTPCARDGGDVTEIDDDPFDAGARQ